MTDYQLKENVRLVSFLIFLGSLVASGYWLKIRKELVMLEKREGYLPPHLAMRFRALVVCAVLLFVAGIGVLLYRFARWHSFW